MTITNSPFKNIDSTELATNIVADYPDIKYEDALNYIESKNMRKFDAASIYYYAVRELREESSAPTVYY